MIIYKVMYVVQRHLGRHTFLCKACNSFPDRCYDMVLSALLQKPLVRPGCLLWSRLGEEGAGPVPMRQNKCWIVGDWRVFWPTVKSHLDGEEELLPHN